MTKRYITSSDLQKWLNDALEANSVYFKVRRRLWDHLFSKLGTSAAIDARILAIQQNAPTKVTLELDDLFTVRSYLLVRNDKITDDGTLAYQKTLEDWAGGIE